MARTSCCEIRCPAGFANPTPNAALKIATCACAILLKPCLDSLVQVQQLNQSLGPEKASAYLCFDCVDRAFLGARTLWMTLSSPLAEFTRAVISGSIFFCCLTTLTFQPSPGTSIPSLLSSLIFFAHSACPYLQERTSAPSCQKSC